MKACGPPLASPSVAQALLPVRLSLPAIPPISDSPAIAIIVPLYLPICLSSRSANSRDVLHPVCLPGLALVWRGRLLPVAGCASDVGPEEARPHSLSLDHIFPIESAHAIVEPSNHG